MAQPTALPSPLTHCGYKLLYIPLVESDCSWLSLPVGAALLTPPSWSHTKKPTGGEEGSRVEDSRCCNSSLQISPQSLPLLHSLFQVLNGRGAQELW